MSQPLTAKLPQSIDECKILKPIKLGGLTLKNRIIRAAAFGGANFDDLIKVHVEVARGGVAMTTIAYASVSSDGRSFESQILLCEDQRENLQRLSDAVHSAGAAISIQLTHAGGFADRKVTGSQQVAPSSVFNPAGFDWPRQMTEDDMDRVAQNFSSSAKFVKESGFDAVELHVGHGYLLSQFLSPHSNRRTDTYGGSIDNRLRFPARVYKDIRTVVGADFPILIKMNMDDGFQGGITLDDAKIVAKTFESLGANALVLSGGFVSRNGFYMLRGTTPLKSLASAMPGMAKKLAVTLFGRWFVPTIPFEEAFFRESAREFLKSVDNIPVCLLGGITSLSTMEGAMSEGFSLVQMARALIHDPNMVKNIEDALSHNKNIEIKSGCTHCNECVIATLDPNRGINCPIRDIENLR
ncbi:unnamed protein product [Owenia fusiformis]|uniref:NADH:flavin oxidoreductase/NADH oxidase N-terminal domain-containing protein n=1 Tax=Owenia fusiformis TaxID=6347 RepID=A0A8S4NLV0_OWEFU|nr:unnamed protein product [Owenia fusiformis]